MDKNECGVGTVVNWEGREGDSESERRHDKRPSCILSKYTLGRGQCTSRSQQGVQREFRTQ